MNTLPNDKLYPQASWSMLIVVLLLSACQTLRPITPGEHEHIEKMDASENELIWIYHLAGVLCETTYYSNTEEAVNALDSVEIQVYDSFQFEIPSCASCGCPTSERFAANIRRYDLDRTKAMGWHFLGDESVIENNKRQ